MKNAFYTVWAERHGKQSLDDKLIAAGVLPPVDVPTIFDMERELIILCGVDALKKIYADNPTREAARARLQRALRAAYQVEDLIDPDPEIDATKYEITTPDGVYNL